MKLMKNCSVRGLCLAGLCTMAAFAFGMTGTASAEILFLPVSHKFPYHMAGVGGESVLETVKGGVEGTIKSTQVDVLLLALSQTLADVHLKFLHTTAAGGLAKCNNVSGETETILVNLLSHIGLADPGFRPAVLMLVPAGFEFVCKPIIGESKTIKVQGSLIGTITHPAVGVDSELLGVVFNQTKGIQEFSTFLLGGQALTNQTELTSISGGAFEQSGQKSEQTLLKALPNEGAFLLILP